MGLFLIGGIAIYGWACAIVGGLAARKGLDRAEYVVIALLMTPFIGLLAVIAEMPDTVVIEKRLIAAGEAKRCQACREVASAKATVCPHCGGTVFEEPPQKPAQQLYFDKASDPTPPRFASREEYEAWKRSQPAGEGQPPTKAT